MDADRLFAEYQHLALIVARQVRRRLARRHLDPDELYTAALLGLWDAARRFNPARGLRFTTLATRRIRGAVLDWLRRAYGFFARKPGEWQRQKYRPLTADPPAPPSPAVRLLDNLDEVEALLRLVSARKAMAMRLVYLDGLSQREAAPRLGVSASRVNQIVTKVSAEIRAARQRLEHSAGGEGIYP